MSARQPHYDGRVPDDAQEAAWDVWEALDVAQCPVFAVRVDREDRIALDVETADWVDLDVLRETAEDAGWHVDDVSDRNLLAYWNADDVEGAGQ